MIMEKRIAILVTVAFGIGMFGGLGIGLMQNKPEHIKADYFIELKPKTVVIEDTHGCTYECVLDSIPYALVSDNL